PHSSFYTAPAPTALYTLSLHDALPISNRKLISATCNRARTILLTIISTCCGLIPFVMGGQDEVFWFDLAVGTMGGLIFSLFAVRSEEHTSELQSRFDLVCRLLLEKKNK